VGAERYAVSVAVDVAGWASTDYTCDDGVSSIRTSGNKHMAIEERLEVDSGNGLLLLCDLDAKVIRKLSGQNKKHSQEVTWRILMREGICCSQR
jgi:hypothetical protein